MKILTAQQIREWDAHSIRHEPIASIDLMERASEAFVDWYTNKFLTREKTAVICGTGNNGGDGLAIARMLLSRNYEVDVFVIKSDAPPTEDFTENEQRFKSIKEIEYLKKSEDLSDFQPYDIIIDGIFGSGLSRAVEGFYAEVIQSMNLAPATTVAIDMPSGLFADKHTSGGAIVEAEHTISFQVPKLAFFFPENQRFVGKWETVDIRLDKNFLKEVKSDVTVLDESQLSTIYKERKNFSHKGDYGKCLLISGSYGKMGAAVLAATAALRTGAGLLTVHAPRCGYSILQTTVPEAMVSPDKDEKLFSTLPDLESYDVIGIGPGIGTDELTLNAYAELLSHWDKPMVIDADGLNLLAKNHHLLDMVPENSILTPHPKEFERLAGETANSFERLKRLKEYASERSFYVLLKGYKTLIATPEGRIFINDTGNPGMATGGTGDVLTGMITALLGQKYTPEEAILLGVWLHGMAGDKAADDIGMESLIASDLVKYIPTVFKYLRERKDSRFSDED